VKALPQKVTVLDDMARLIAAGRRDVYSEATTPHLSEEIPEGQVIEAPK